MEGCKPSATPMASNLVLSIRGDDIFSDHTLYRSIVEALEYITLIWLDLSFTINKCYQFMVAPKMSHWLVVKLVLKYLYGTVMYGLVLKIYSQLFIQGFF